MEFQKKLENQDIMKLCNKNYFNYNSYLWVKKFKKEFKNRVFKKKNLWLKHMYDYKFVIGSYYDSIQIYFTQFALYARRYMNKAKKKKSFPFVKFNFFQNILNVEKNATFQFNIYILIKYGALMHFQRLKKNYQFLQTAQENFQTALVSHSRLFSFNSIKRLLIDLMKEVKGINLSMQERKKNINILINLIKHRTNDPILFLIQTVNQIVPILTNRRQLYYTNPYYNRTVYQNNKFLKLFGTYGIMIYISFKRIMQSIVAKKKVNKTNFAKLLHSELIEIHLKKKKRHQYFNNFTLSRKLVEAAGFQKKMFLYTQKKQKNQAKYNFFQKKKNKNLPFLKFKVFKKLKSAQDKKDKKKKALNQFKFKKRTREKKKFFRKQLKRN